MAKIKGNEKLLVILKAILMVKIIRTAINTLREKHKAHGKSGDTSLNSIT